MLPLWIVDLRQKTPRREIFESLLGEIEHVYIPKTKEEKDVNPQVIKEIEDENEKGREDGNTTLANFEPSVSTVAKKKVDAEVVHVYEDDMSEEISVEERIDAREKKKAQKESIIEGNWWRYSPIADKDYKIKIDNGVSQSEAGEVATRLYDFQCDLVKEGQEFIRALRESNARPDIKLNVIVLGDIEEEFTRLLFPSIAGMIQKEKGRILPHHIHQGMEIIGMLYIPSNINTLKVELRDSMLRTLNEIDVQHNVPDMRGYDHMMLYQDVQNRTECVYPALNDEQIEQYLLQCIINLYMASDESHPLLSGTASAEVFYFSMGATSVCYDVENEDLKARHNFGLNFMRSLKKEGDDEKANLKLTILNSKDYDADKFFDEEALNQIDTNYEKQASPRPHPIKNFAHKYLKKSYYDRYLRRFTGNLMEDISSKIEESTRGAIEIIASKSKSKFKIAKKHIHERLKDILGDLSYNDGGFPTIIRLFREMQEKLSAKKKNLPNVIDVFFWDDITTGDQSNIPSKMRDRFNEYHQAYEEDIKRKTGGTMQADIKKEAVAELNELLGRETPMLSRLCRSVLLGIVLALALVPILNLISPHLFDLGRVRRYAEWWSLGIFFLPVLFQLLSWWRYERKKNRAVNNLKALYLHDAYARVANRMETEIGNFYDKLINLAEQYVKRTERIRREIETGYQDVQFVKAVIPETMFNQPLLGGKFGREKLLPTPEAENTVVSIKYINYKTSELTDVEYYLYLNEHHNMVHGLYDGVDISENLVRRTKEDGSEVLVTKEEQEKEQEAQWKISLKKFQTELSESIQAAIVPRINDTVGEVLVNAIDGKLVQEDVMQPVVEYAASNGEFTSSADLEITDVKINDPRAVKYVLQYVSSSFQNDQVDKYNYLYKKYIFISRWRCFDFLPLNRILPMEDFDENVRNQLVYEEESATKAKKYGKKSKPGEKEMFADSKQATKEIKKYRPYPSSLLLWALSPDDSSTEWFRLLDDYDFFKYAYEDKVKYKEILNQND